jgi:RNA polymerase sigma factor (sigma-70 family)
MFLSPDTLYRIKVKVMTNPSEFEYALQVDYAGEDENRARVALTQLIEIHEALLRKKSGCLSSQPSDASDVYSKTAKILWEKRQRYTVGSIPWIFWAYRVMGGVASDMRRQRKGELASRMHPIGDREFAVNQVSPSDTLYFKEFSQSLGECLAKLNAEDRHVFVMRQYANLPFEHVFLSLNETIKNDMTFRAIADSLEITLSNARLYYDRATKQLNACLRSKGHTEMDLINEHQ